MQDDIELILPTLLPYLKKFAVIQLKNDVLADDIIQETFLAALENKSSFRHEAELKSWLIAILKNKIVDLIRSNKAKPTISVEDIKLDEFDGLFDNEGHWNSIDAPSSWGSPYQTLENSRFWEIFEICMSELPEKLARVFSMAEFLGFQANEICKELEISASNYWVIMYRARMQLRLCIEKRWLTY